jgi:membrane-associated phospholipid phosphatase
MIQIGPGSCVNLKAIVIAVCVTGAALAAAPAIIIAGEDPDAAGTLDPAVSAPAADTPAGGIAAEFTSDATPDKPYWRTNLFKRTWTDQKFLFSDWMGHEAHEPGFLVPFTGGILLATAGNRRSTDHLDLEVERHFEASVNGNSREAAFVFSDIGNAGPGVLMLGVGYLVGHFGHHDQLTEASSLSAEALLNTGLWVTVLKTATSRLRPAGGGDGSFFQSPGRGQSNASFPSGHAAGAFAVATVFSGIYGPEHRWVSWVAYGTAGLVGVSRVALGRHFTSDVVVGGAIGNSFGRMALERNDRGRKDSRRAVLEPVVDPATGTAGLGFDLVW